MAKKYPKDYWKVPFNLPHFVGTEIENIKNTKRIGQLSGEGFYTKNVQRWIENNIHTKKAILVHSCTAALEIMALSTKLKPGDEIIMPSFTFVTTANAFVLRGIKPVFVDIREDTLNINESLIESAITSKTKAIMCVHYAGVACEMDTIMKIGKKYNLLVFEDAAQGFLSKYKGRFLGSIGHLGAFSFHETKNITSGEGGSLLINDLKFKRLAEIAKDCGTNKNSYIKGEVSEYTWVNVGSSYGIGELDAAFLFAQMEKSREITKRRVSLWREYHRLLEPLEKLGHLRRPIVPKDVIQNGHIYYILVKDNETRNKLIQHLKENGVMSVFHYIPLHSSKGGKKYSRVVGSMDVTNKVSKTLARLPLYYDLSLNDVHHVVSCVKSFFDNS